MEKIKKYSGEILLICLIFLIWKNWFLPLPVSAGDLGNNFISMYASIYLYPYAYAFNQHASMGGSTGVLIPIYIDSAIPVIFGKLFSAPWEIAERIGLLYPFLLCGFFSIGIFVKKFFRSSFIWLATLLYLCNTYILLITAGGQILIAIGYIFAPIVLTGFFLILHDNKNKIRNILLASLFLSLEVLIDLRSAFIIFFAICFYWIFYQIVHRQRNLFLLGKSFSFFILIPLLLTVFLHAFWISPVVSSHQNPTDQLTSSYTSTDAVSYFSFAKFENTVSLLHPNWPENIFGKTTFQRPEFLLITILAYSSLLFIKKTKNEKEKQEHNFVLFFSILGFIGAFLAKGVNDPFGQVYLWLFHHVPGFVMFRDPTKWYLLVAISYAILIPYAIYQTYSFLKERYRNFLAQFFVILCIGYFCWLIYPAIQGNIRGTFQKHPIPNSYTILADKLHDDKTFFRTLWIPSSSRFSFTSVEHPAVPAEDFYAVSTLNSVFTFLQRPDAQRTLQESSIKYIIVPYDSEGEIFIVDRKYNEKLYRATIQKLQHIPWLTQAYGFGNLAVFQVKQPKDHLWLVSGKGSVSFLYKNPVMYTISLKNVTKNDHLILSDTFDPQWIMKTGTTTIHATNYHGMNSFKVPQSNTFPLTLEYRSQTYVTYGLILSVITGISIMIVLAISYKNR